MSDYRPSIINNNDGTFHAVVVCIEDDGFKRVAHGYKGRLFKSKAAAIRSTTNHIKKYNL